MGIKLYILFIAACFALGACFICIWALWTGQFHNVEDIKHDMLDDEKGTE